jgi:RNA polymerase sigma-70 factor (ECF subfamily)
VSAGSLALAFAGRESPELEAELAAIVAGARSAWPMVTTISDERFVAALAKHVEPGADALKALEALRVMHAEDVFLATACADGDEAAIRLFDDVLLTEVRARLSRMGFSTAVADEALQSARETLFVVQQEGEAPQIAHYSGRGSLRGWLRAVVVRAAVRLARKSGSEVPLKGSLQASLDDPELEYIKRRYTAPFEHAWREALATLPASDRLLLKQRFVHGLGLDDLGSLYGVHASTMSRRLSDARERLVSSTKDAMVRKVKMSRGEVSSILRLIRSQLDLRLASQPPGESDGSR